MSFDSDGDEEDVGTGGTWMPMGYPPPPSDAPRSGLGKTSAALVLSVCKLIERFVAPNPAIRAHGIETDLYDWERNAQEGSDPFWAWAVDCVERAEAAAEARVSVALEGRVVAGDTKAIMYYLDRRSKNFEPKKTVNNNVTTRGVSVNLQLTGKLEEMLQGGGTSIPELMEARRRRQLEARPDLEVDEVEIEPHPHFRVKAKDAGAV